MTDALQQMLSSEVQSLTETIGRGHPDRRVVIFAWVLQGTQQRASFCSGPDAFDVDDQRDVTLMAMRDLAAWMDDQAGESQVGEELDA